MSQALYRKWRPARFDDVVGQEHVTRTLRNSVTADRVGHAYLFCGPRGTGKTTTARLLAKAVNCLHPERAQRPCNECAPCRAIGDGRFLDLIEIDAASNTGVDDIRDLRDKINFTPNEGRFKVYIIDEVHMLSTAAFNALLKTLEEPPSHAKFVLATTEEHKVPSTIKSRCQQFNFRLLTQSEIEGRLAWLAEQESLTIEAEALTLIAQQGSGSIRDAESLLDQLVVAPGDTITLERAQQVLGTATNTAVIRLSDAWLDGDGAAGLSLIHEALASGADARQFCRQMVAYLRQLLLLQAAGEALMLDVPAEAQETMLAQARRARRADLIKAVKGFQHAAMTPASSWQPQLPLELAFIDLLPEEPMPLVTPSPAPPTTAEPTTATAETAVAETAPPSSPAVGEEAETTDETEGAETAVVEPAPQTEPEPVAESVEEPAGKPAEATPSGKSALTLARVTKQWPKMKNLVAERNRNLPPLLAMSKPLAVEGEIIVLGFDYPIFKEKFDNISGAAEAVGTAFSELLDTTCHVRAVVTSEYTVPVSKQAFHALADELGGIVREET